MAIPVGCEVRDLTTRAALVKHLVEDHEVWLSPHPPELPDLDPWPLTVRPTVGDPDDPEVHYLLDQLPPHYLDENFCSTTVANIRSTHREGGPKEPLGPVVPLM